MMFLAHAPSDRSESSPRTAARDAGLRPVEALEEAAAAPVVPFIRQRGGDVDDTIRESSLEIDETSSKMIRRRDHENRFRVGRDARRLDRVLERRARLVLVEGRAAVRAVFLRCSRVAQTTREDQRCVELSCELVAAVDSSRKCRAQGFIGQSPCAGDYDMAVIRPVEFRFVMSRGGAPSLRNRRRVLVRGLQSPSLLSLLLCVVFSACCCRISAAICMLFLRHLLRLVLLL